MVCTGREDILQNHELTNVSNILAASTVIECLVSGLSFGLRRQQPRRGFGSGIQTHVKLALQRLRHLEARKTTVTDSAIH